MIFGIVLMVLIGLLVVALLIVIIGYVARIFSRYQDLKSKSKTQAPTNAKDDAGPALKTDASPASPVNPPKPKPD